jgi:hypothetical protein
VNYFNTKSFLLEKKTYFGLMRSRIRAQAMIAPEFSMGLYGLSEEKKCCLILKFNTENK